MNRDRKKQKLEEEEERNMEVVVVEQVDALAAAATVAAAAAVEEEEGLWGMWLKEGDVVVDELMTWSTVLPSCWDVEFVEKNYGVLFEDVVWDDDLWNLNTSTQLPPLDNNTRQD
ncbi:unnamed protein product [Brassica oleracea var. botrytis]|uniref:Uncharacterized protein n=4 Tax=Brassica TaxID=3705 RepID=A0A8S9N4H4_BRACR|nr:uncharacterized protein LOC106364786 [Brassica napus]KAF3488632.1 hypothetical protein F2Q69_00054278 [Brassica cretica]KAG2265595.1 hypothetical protein Bca52824_072674 [Brassica carinata]CAF1974481.1 unnamed protein product [Brassica napus]VDD36820.1 unnamed protein product [Brassica oleracea]